MKNVESYVSAFNSVMELIQARKPHQPDGEAIDAEGLKDDVQNALRVLVDAHERLRHADRENGTKATLPEAMSLVVDLAARYRVPLPSLTGNDPTAAADWLRQIADAVELVIARPQMVRAPMPAVSTFTDLRTGRLKHGETPQRTRDPTGKTFTIAGELFRYFDLRTEDLQLALPFRRDDALTDQTVGRHVRGYLTGAVERAWLATFRLNEEWDEGHAKTAGMGLFELDVRHVLWDLYALPRKTFTLRGETRYRPSDAARREFLKQFEKLQHMFVYGIGEGDGKIIPGDPQRLIGHYDDGRGSRRVYQHAQAVLLAMRGEHRSFLQFPVAALRLSSEDTPLALGLAALWRRVIFDAVYQGPGHYTTTLRALAEAVGEDWRAGVRRYGGHAFWSTFAETVSRVMRDGDLGTARVSGDHADAEVVLVPSDALAVVYRSYARARVSAIKREARTREAAETLAKARTLPGRKRGKR